MFINNPTNFSSMWEDLIFEYTRTDETDLLIEIQDARTDELLGVKKLYSSKEISLNVAPIFFSTMMPVPEYFSTLTFGSTTYGFPKILLTDGEFSSDALYFTYAKEQVSERDMLTTMPLSRILRPGECDLIYFVTPEQSAVRFIILGVNFENDVNEEIMSISSNGSDQVVILNIAADEFIKSYDIITVEADNSDQIYTVNYTLCEQIPNSYRVAWISQSGSIEQYTFPQVVSKSYLSSGATTKTLLSSYGSQAEVEALAQIVSSPKVWHFEDGEFTEIEVLTTEVEILKQGVLSVTTIKIQENG